jgi:hypothetical protein
MGAIARPYKIRYTQTSVIHYVEVEMTEINLFNRWKVSKKKFWFSLGGLVIVSICGIITLVSYISSHTYAMNRIASAPMSYGDMGYAMPAEEGVMMEAPAPAMEKSADDGYYAAEQSVANTESTVPIDRLIIRNGDISVEVESTRDTHDKIENIVLSMREQGAFVLSSVESGGEKDNPYISMVIRVPAVAFDNMMDQIADMAVVVDSRNEHAEDVTEEYFDLDNRLESMEAARQRLLKIMENADTTEDLLVAEQQLTQREVEIESLKGRIKYLSDSARLSRITISIQPYHLAQPIDTRWKPLETVREAIDDLIDGLQGFAEFLIYFAIAVLPWLLLFGFVIWLVIKYIRRRKAKKEAKEE